MEPVKKGRVMFRRFQGCFGPKKYILNMFPTFHLCKKHKNHLREPLDCHLRLFFVIQEVSCFSTLLKGDLVG